MSDRKDQLVARINELLQARREELRKIAELEARPRLRVIDRAFAALAV